MQKWWGERLDKFQEAKEEILEKRKEIMDEMFEKL
jgi:hypothetical protein